MSEMIRMKPCSAVARPLAPDAIVQDTPRGAPRTTPAPLGPPGRAALVIAAMVGVVAGTATAGDWPQILGPERSGRAAADERLADAWPAGGPKVVWKRDVGHGYAGVVVAADRALLFHRRGGEEGIEALDAATGKTLWTDARPTSFRPQVGGGDGPARRARRRRRGLVRCPGCPCRARHRDGQAEVAAEDPRGVRRPGGLLRRRQFAADVVVVNVGGTKHDGAKG